MEMLPTVQTKNQFSNEQPHLRLPGGNMLKAEELALAVNCVNNQLQGITNLQRMVTTLEFQQVIDELSRFNDYSHRIIIAGVGKNANIAAKIAETMVSIGLPSLALNVSHASHGDYGFVGPHDAIIYISKSGKTAELLACAQHIKSIKPEVYQLLLHLNSSFDQQHHFSRVLHCGDVVEGDEYQLAPTSSTTTLLCALDTISVVLSHRVGWSPRDFLRYHPNGSLGEKLRSELGDESK
jgi:arabinose-5-phosphate isomerase